MLGVWRKRVRRHVGFSAVTGYSTPRKLLNLFLNNLERRLRVVKPRSLPYRLAIDVTNVCNLHCPFCPTGVGLKGRDKCFMGLERYKRIIDEIGDYVYVLDLFNWGEPLLHKSVYEMVKYASDRKICTRISTNFSVPFSDEAAQQMVESGLSYLTVSCDGIDQQSYEMYRRGGSFDLVLENVERLVKTKEKLRASNPYIFWQYLVFKHNEDLVEEARLAAGQAGVDAFETLTGGVFDEAWATSKTHSFIPGLFDDPCAWLWKQFVVHADGGVAPCCGEFWKRDDYGSIDDGTIRELRNNERFVKSRALFRRGASQVGETELYCAGCYKAGGSRRPWIEFARHSPHKEPE